MLMKDAAGNYWFHLGNGNGAMPEPVHVPVSEDDVCRLDVRDLAHIGDRELGVVTSGTIDLSGMKWLT